jgi:large subunit ribosomal protein L18
VSKKTDNRQAARLARHRRIRRKVKGTAECPRLCIFRSARHIYAQVIDDNSGCTLVSASTQDKGMKKTGSLGGGIAAAKEVGERVAERAKTAKIKQVVFDRGGFDYHGRIAALADAARKSGLKF